jgi:hypothetical protein
MGDNFHSADCGLRLGQTICTCGYVKPKTDKEVVAALTGIVKTFQNALDVKEIELAERDGTIDKLRSYLEEARIIISRLPDNNIAAQVWLDSLPKEEK